MTTLNRVRGKFVVNRIVRHRGSCLNLMTKEYESCEQQTVELGIRYDTKNNPEDHTYAEATPSGKVELSITKPEVVGFFELDKAYYVDFTAVADASGS